MLSYEQNNDVATPYTLCTKCTAAINFIRDYLQHSTGQLERPRHSLIAQYHVPEVQASGLSGCHLCSIISQATCPAHSPKDILADSDSVVRVHMARNISGNRDSKSPLIFLSAQMKTSKGELLRDVTLSVEADPDRFPDRSVPASWSFSTSSDATFDLARSWLHHCLSEHNLCEEVRKTPASAKSSAFPTYLLRIEPEKVYLCRARDENGRPRYLTLSHRWGGSRIMKLTSNNLSTFLSSIDINQLPKTFKDAIFITRKLGYEYIWIDSLCIIQDSADHWKSESAIMGDIYRGSVCTIAALGATDGESGCFKSRNPLCFQRYNFELLSGQKVYIPPEKEKTLLNQTGYGPNVEPLHQRAWVMQERILSPRTLFYGTCGIYWECVLGSVESNVSSKMIQGSGTTTKYAIYQACTLNVTGRFDMSYKMFWQWWTKIISMYNPCGLTYGTDKLVAIAGIVNLVQSKTGLHSLAGMWREYILPELLWHVERPRRRPSGVYQAPTWSWASLDSEVSPGIQDFNYTFNWKIDITDAAATLVAENGQISSAYIRVRGPLLKVRWEIPDEDEDEDEYSGYKLRWGSMVPEPNSADDRVIFLPDIKPNPGTDVYALQVVHATSSSSWMKMGLVVALKAQDSDEEDAGEEVWVRVGSFRQYDWPVNTTSFFEEGQADVHVQELMIV
ncbi:hypothetical protein JR316_0012673 [Psilocybe cubensis]|uniref:Uncharacterized protein n=2 Tax=Psilocybe cubensis TaxID=181762 RepID=A0ACB8GJI7_PSICU|nr:hypothetical protein JR316_0012673 [Psilocybe cubensis]KAH9475557.1 hypothetical protein JR316_0012673 [Psilocybe cubensis]